MATDSVLGLFADPQQYQMQQQQAAMDRGMKLAQLDPFQQATAQMYQGGYLAGGALAGALGGQDPQLQAMSTRQQVLKDFDLNTVEGITGASNALRQRNDLQGAYMLAQRADEAALKESMIAKNLRERSPNEPEIVRLQNSREQLASRFGEADPRVQQIDAAIAKMTRQGKSLEETMGSGLGAIAAAMGGAQAKKAAEAGGTEVGKQTANIQGKYTALGSINDAVTMLDKGIYSGGYGPMQEAAAKYAGGILRKDRLANTQEFRAYIGDVVIPRLQEFGGNDSVEELKYLRSVMAGDTSMEGTAIKNILQKADRKIRSGIDRIEQQQKSIQTGKPLPTGDTSSVMKATKRFNPQTGELEVVK